MSIFDGTLSPTPLGNGLVIGQASHINGADAALTGFVVTKHELEQVARYWFDQRLDNDFFCFFYDCSGSYEWRLSRYSSERLHAIGQVLGDDRMRVIENEVAAVFQKDAKLDDEGWRIFTTGSAKEQAACGTP